MNRLLSEIQLIFSFSFFATNNYIPKQLKANALQVGDAQIQPLKSNFNVHICAKSRDRPIGNQYSVNNKTVIFRCSTFLL